jgi:hypothetical protein
MPSARNTVSNVYPPGGDLGEEQYVDAGHADRVDVQEVAGEDALGLRGEELGPGRSGDAAAAPGRVVAGQPQHQLPHLCGDGWATGAPCRIGPSLSYEVAVPAKQGGRGDQERRPPHPWQQPGQTGQHRPVGWFQVQPPHLAAQHRNLVP